MGWECMERSWTGVAGAPRSRPDPSHGESTQAGAVLWFLASPVGRPWPCELPMKQQKQHLLANTNRRRAASAPLMITQGAQISSIRHDTVLAADSESSDHAELSTLCRRILMRNWS